MPSWRDAGMPGCPGAGISDHRTAAPPPPDRRPPPPERRTAVPPHKAGARQERPVGDRSRVRHQDGRSFAMPERFEAGRRTEPMTTRQTGSPREADRRAERTSGAEPPGRAEGRGGADRRAEHLTGAEVAARRSPTPGRPAARQSRRPGKGGRGRPGRTHRRCVGTRPRRSPASGVRRRCVRPDAHSASAAPSSRRSRSSSPGKRSSNSSRRSRLTRLGPSSRCSTRPAPRRTEKW